MRSLKVLSLAKNKIKNIPSCVKDLDTLRMLRLAGNPLRSELAAIIEAKDTYPPYDELTDNERETFTTSNLKHQLRAEAEAVARESGDGSRLAIHALGSCQSLIWAIAVKVLWRLLAH